MKKHQEIKNLIARIKHLDQIDIELLFSAILTPQELEIMEKRCQLIKELLKNTPHREISQKLKISISQITRGSKELKYGIGGKIFPKIFKPTKLEEIIENKIQEIKKLPEISDNFNIVELPKIKSFKNFISQKFAIIAEIKTKSPSEGFITENKIQEIADEYIDAKIDAMSVLTDKKFFNGSFNEMLKISKKTTIPILCKDFIIDKKQIYNARIYGAAAVLLIVKVIKNQKKLSELVEFAKSLSLDCLVEISNQEELDIAINANAEIIGINSRNLDTFEVDIEIFKNLFQKIPSNITKVALSGINTPADISELKNICNAVLIGTHFCKMPIQNIANEVQNFKNAI
jgi:indole-3-glycerol phosphate synthase